jgi:4-hydroxybenzoate adenylyltransferase
VGIRVPQYGTTWPTLRDAALRAERLGFDGLWLNDHLQSPGRLKSEPTFDALTTLAALAALTRHARLGVAVLSASYRNPGLAAKMATVLDVISGGRLVVGLGTGSDRPEHEAYGYPFGSPRERTAGVRTALAVMRAMWEDPEAATVPDAIAGAPNAPAPEQCPGPPIWLAAHGPRLLRLAGEKADGVFAAFVGPEEVAERRRVAEEAREAAGRPALDYAIYTYALPVPSTAEAERWVAPEAEALGTTPARFLRWLRTTGIVAEPDELRGRLAAFAAAGATDAILVMPSRVPDEALDALAGAALPAGARREPGAEAPPVEVGEGGPAPDAARPVGPAPEGNLVHRLVEVNRAAGRGGDLAAIDDDGSWTFDELAEAATRAAGALAERGVRPGGRVAIMLPDGRPWLAAFLGAAWLGAVAVPLDPAMPGDRLRDVLDDCEPAVVTADGDAADGAGERPLVSSAVLLSGDPAEPADVDPSDLAYLVYSSGSTGRPKAAMHAHGDLAVGIETYARRVLELAPGDRCHSVAKLYTSLGFGNGFFRVLGSGATCVLSSRRPTPRSVLRVVQEHGVTVLTAVPTAWAQLATFVERHPDAADLRSVRLCVSSGDSLPPAVARRLREVLGLEVLEGLGCSECSNIIISTRPGEALPGTLGRAVPGIEIRLVDEEGEPVEEGQPGRLWVRSDSNTSGYWRRPELTEELLFGPWIRMGDVLSQTDGVFRHLGRSDDLFKVDARWVSPSEVEGALHDHPAVAEAVVVGRADDDGLLRSAAFVVLAEGAEGGDDLADELRRHVAHRLEPYKAPTTVAILDELPRLASGKLDRRRLREGAAAEDGA